MNHSCLLPFEVHATVQFTKYHSDLQQFKMAREGATAVKVSRPAMYLFSGTFLVAFVSSPWPS